MGRAPGTSIACRGWLRPEVEGSLRVERTRNIWLMSVTPEVSQLETSASKRVKPKKSQLMSVMAETSQSVMRPCVAVAAVGLALYAWTAVFREAVVVKA